MLRNDSTSRAPARIPFRGRLAWFAAVLLTLMLAGAPPAAAQSGVLTGTVVDPSLNPIPGARVRTVAGPSVGRQTLAAANGVYTLVGLGVGFHTVEASFPGFDPTRTSVFVGFGVTRQDFTLFPAATVEGSIQGRVTRRNTGQPIPGARVVASAGFNEFIQLTDQNGAFAFPNLPTGAYQVSVSRDGFTPASRSGITVTPGSTALVNFALAVRAADLGRIQGTVSDPNGVRLPGVQVRLADGLSAGATAITNAQGVYTLANVVPDSYQVEFSAPNFNVQTRGVTVLPGQTVPLDVTLPPIAVSVAGVEGFVLDLNRVPIQGAFVQVLDGPTVVATDVTDAEGFYQIPNLPPGQYAVGVSATGFQAQTQFVLVQADRSTRRDFLLRRLVAENAGSIAGRVTRATDGQGLAGVGVSVDDTFRARTDAQGDYVLPALSPGTHVVAFFLTGFQPHAAEVDVVAGETTQLNVELVPLQGGRITGQVLDLGGTPLPGITVVATHPTSGQFQTTTDAQGQFALAGLPAGQYRVRFSGPDHAPHVEDPVLVREGETTNVVVRLSPAPVPVGEVRGLVRNLRGRALRNALVRLSGPAGVLVAQTDARGRFRFVRVPIGAGQRLTVTANGFRPVQVNGINVREGQVTQANVRLSPLRR